MSRTLEVGLRRRIGFQFLVLVTVVRAEKPEVPLFIDPLHAHRPRAGRVPCRQGALDPAIGNEPHERDENVDPGREPGAKKGNPDRGRVENGRDLALEVMSKRCRQGRARIDLGQDKTLQDVIGDCGEKQDRAVNGGRQRSK